MFIGKKLDSGEQSPKGDRIKVFKFSSKDSYGSIALFRGVRCLEGCVSFESILGLTVHSQ